MPDTAAKVAEQARDAWAALGKFFSRKLPSGVELVIPELGVENKLLAFIEDPQRPVDDKTRFSFDRLTFETRQEHPIADNSTPEGRAKNRRIDIRVVSK